MHRDGLDKFLLGKSYRIFWSTSIGAAISLIVGKPVGILLSSWFATVCGLAALPEGVSWYQMWGIGVLAGIGFTMSLFIAGSAFSPGPSLMAAKEAILLASTIAGLTGWLLLRYASETQKG